MTDVLFVPPFTAAEIESSVGARFRKVAAAIPDQPAVCDGEVTLTFAQLDAESDAFARSLAGLDPDHPIGLVFSPGISSVVAFLGAYKSGLTAIPVDPFAAPEGIDSALARTQRIATEPRFADWCRQKAPAVPVVTDWHGTDGALPPDPGPRTRAVIYLTSATTGLAKGVVHDQRNMLMWAYQQGQDKAILPGDRVSIMVSFAHILTGVFMLSGLLAGATLELYDLRARGVVGVPAWAQRRGVTLLYTAVPVLRQLIQILIDAPLDWKPRQVKFGGDAIVTGDLHRMRHVLGWDGPLINLVGSAEAGAIATWAVDLDLLAEGAVVPTGYPFDSIRLQIQDEDGTPLPQGELGEIVVSGSFVSYGYWEAPQMTAERFSNDPDDPDRRVYRTGDLGRMRPDGLLEHVGRKDHYVKIRGNGVMLPAVEAIMRRLPGVTDAVVAPSRDPQGVMRLVGYVVLQPGTQTSPLALRRTMGAELPNFMVPWKVMILDAIPMTAGGKVARRDLPDPRSTREDWMPPYVPPLPGPESDLADLWRSVLRLDQIGRDDDFFELGGDSLDLAGIASGFGQRRGLDVGDADLFARTTLRGMTEVLLAAGVDFV